MVLVLWVVITVALLIGMVMRIPTMDILIDIPIIFGITMDIATIMDMVMGILTPMGTAFYSSFGFFSVYLFLPSKHHI